MKHTLLCGTVSPSAELPHIHCALGGGRGGGVMLCLVYTGLDSLVVLNE